MKITPEYLNELYFKEQWKRYEHQEFYSFTADLLSNFDWFYEYLSWNDPHFFYLSYVLMSELKYYIFECLRDNNIDEIDMIFAYVTKYLWISKNLDDLIWITLLEELYVFDQKIISIIVSFMTNDLKEDFMKNYAEYLHSK